MVLAKVRPSNNYGGNAPEGSLVEVDEAELARVPWCLEKVGDALPADAPPMQDDEPLEELQAEADAAQAEADVADARASEYPEAADAADAKAAKAKARAAKAAAKKAAAKQE